MVSTLKVSDLLYYVRVSNSFAWALSLSLWPILPCVSPSNPLTSSWVLVLSISSDGHLALLPISSHSLQSLLSSLQSPHSGSQRALPTRSIGISRCPFPSTWSWKSPETVSNHSLFIQSSDLFHSLHFPVKLLCTQENRSMCFWCPNQTLTLRSRWYKFWLYSPDLPDRSLLSLAYLIGGYLSEIVPISSFPSQEEMDLVLVLLLPLE